MLNLSYKIMKGGLCMAGAKEKILEDSRFLATSEYGGKLYALLVKERLCAYECVGGTCVVEGEPLTEALISSVPDIAVWWGLIKSEEMLFDTDPETYALLCDFFASSILSPPDESGSDDQEAAPKRGEIPPGAHSACSEWSRQYYEALIYERIRVYCMLELPIFTVMWQVFARPMWQSTPVLTLFTMLLLEERYFRLNPDDFPKLEAIFRRIDADFREAEVVFSKPGAESSEVAASFRKAYARISEADAEISNVRAALSEIVSNHTKRKGS
jgi:hypothetical protein